MRGTSGLLGVGEGEPPRLYAGVLELAGVEASWGVPGPVGAGVAIADGGAGIEMS